jgi:hypothetical protein
MVALRLVQEEPAELVVTETWAAQLQPDAENVMPEVVEAPAA